MTRPDDISQAIWDEAEHIAYDISSDGYGGVEHQPAQLAIARALSDAYARGLEDAARVADLTAQEVKAEANYDIYCAGMQDASTEIASAIRALGSK